ncbi:MAG: hypothetical protein FJ368_02975 [Pelagibacterales bacterium]|nr:hypothetical protein [Pelagibacterales bacterium]
MTNSLANQKNYVFILDEDNTDTNNFIILAKEMCLFALIGEDFIYRLDFNKMQLLPEITKNKEIVILIDKNLHFWDQETVTKENIIFESENYMAIKTGVKLKYAIKKLQENITKPNLTRIFMSQ